jgi:DNA repair exonuclease SbcCD nuclease subunit
MSHLVIYHLSDWHIAYNNDVTYRLESHEAHNTTFNNIKSHIHNHNITTPIIVITGDIFTFKTELRGYDVEEFYKFIKLYSSIAPIFCIPGLCDGNIEREIDLLKPLIENVKDSKYPIHYLNSNTPQYFDLYNKKICMCGINILNNNTGKYSLYDIFINDHCLDLYNRNYDISICLVHGNITNEELKSSLDISTDFTDMFDVVCAGSIHNYKTINNSAYCGSLFQQNRNI